MRDRRPGPGEFLPHLQTPDARRPALRNRVRRCPAFRFWACMMGQTRRCFRRAAAEWFTKVIYLFIFCLLLAGAVTCHQGRHGDQLAICYVFAQRLSAWSKVGTFERMNLAKV